MLFPNWTILSSLIDVIVVSFVVYRILILVKGTRAGPMLAGLAMIFLIYVVARELGLVTLTWILGNFLGSAIFVVVVLFQEDIRRGLIQMGLGPGLGMGMGKGVEQKLKEICRAAAELSSRRLGALIVIQRDVGLEEFTENAVKLNADISYQLMISIFLPTSPLHDGAVVCSGNKIIAAGSVLPLTFNPNVSRGLGTRHRAAIGVSERSDALVIVVSEETGTISLVREGRITRDLNEKSLLTSLTRLIVIREQKRNQALLKRILRRPKSRPDEDSEATKSEPTSEVMVETVQSETTTPGALISNNREVL
ncbi:TIGR00159 family protein [bacterium]|nr:TIGR00159 family protein [bacterium]